MKAIHIGSVLFATTLVIMFFSLGNAFSENSTPSQNTLQPHSVSLEARHPLVMAHQQLDQARAHYQEGEMGKVKIDLEVASKWLQGYQNAEAIKLASEIKLLQEKINHPSIEHEGAISRLWHRSSTLVVREIEHATKLWNDSSTANTTLKHLIDARMSFSYAEHDLFVNHNAEKANNEIDSTLAYLDKANEVAIPRVHEKITSLKKYIQRLPTRQTNGVEVQTIIQELELAGASVNKASHSTSPEIEAQSKKIAKEISDLQKNIFILEKRQQYDSVMDRLHQLDKLL